MYAALFCGCELGVTECHSSPAIFLRTRLRREMDISVPPATSGQSSRKRPLSLGTHDSPPVIARWWISLIIIILTPKNSAGKV